MDLDCPVPLDEDDPGLAGLFLRDVTTSVLGFKLC